MERLHARGLDPAALRHRPTLDEYQEFYAGAYAALARPDGIRYSDIAGYVGIYPTPDDPAVFADTVKAIEAELWKTS